MSREMEKSRLFTRRAVLIGGLQAGLFSLLAGRLYYLQVMQGDRFKVLADDNRIHQRLILPPRGQILDRTGKALALNQQTYRVVLLPEHVTNLAVLLRDLKEFITLSENDERRIERDFKSKNRLNAVLVRENLSWDQVSEISLNIHRLMGAEVEVGEVRAYPYGILTSHIVGYVGPFSPSDMQQRQHEDKDVPGARVGKNGIERHYDSMLRGRPGRVQLEVNAKGLVVRELQRYEPKAGQDLPLTLDITLQQIVQERLAQERSAAAVVMDVYTGAVYALVSHPGFDSNLFAYGISQKDWSGLNNDELVPLLNKAVDGFYAPGSTFKIVTALAALEAGLVKPKEHIYCPGFVDLGNHRFHCWKRGGHGHMDLVTAMAASCDTYFYELAKRVGIDRLHEMAKRLGFGEKTGIDFPYERGGLMPSRSWKMVLQGTSWQQGETLLAAIGQGSVLASPLQLAAMMARVVNGGFAVTPHMTKQPEKTTGRSLGFQPRSLAIMKEALIAVVNKPFGTAYGSRLEEGLSMAGKTGTSQVRRISMAERATGIISNDALPWRERDHALFISYAPVEKPRYAGAVIIEHGGSGAAKAAPVMRDILAACQHIRPEL
ncbi:MAG: penicillin-binding protein 2 [Alphaproteobacteria bacterium]|nr:penicillin-binding protein 2 [Alphaproteobacteria bacterium]